MGSAKYCRGVCSRGMVSRRSCKFDYWLCFIKKTDHVLSFAKKNVCFHLTSFLFLLLELCFFFQNVFYWYSLLLRTKHENHDGTSFHWSRCTFSLVKDIHSKQDWETGGGAQADGGRNERGGSMCRGGAQRNRAIEAGTVSWTTRNVCTRLWHFTPAFEAKL